MTYISKSSVFMLHLEDNLMYFYHILGLCGPVILSYISHYLIPKSCLMSYLHVMTQCDPNFHLKVNINQYDLYLMV